MHISRKKKQLMLDIGERAVNTFWQAFVAIWLATGLDLGWETVRAGLFAGALAVIKGTVASKVGSPNTAALLPSGPDTDKG